MLCIENYLFLELKTRCDFQSSTVPNTEASTVHKSSTTADNSEFSTTATTQKALSK